jgi:glutamyl/glutaminyl-tRNA synthetase
LDEAKEAFDIAKVNKTGAVFSLDKLKWVNAEYIRGKTLAEFISLARQYLEENNCLPVNVDNDYLEKVLNLFKERVYTLSDLKDWIGFCFAKEVQYAPETQNILENNLSKEIGFLIERFKAIEDFKSENIEHEFRKVAEELNVKAKILVHPSRVALTGKKIGPGLFETMEVLGKDKVIERLQKLINHWGGEHA